MTHAYLSRSRSFYRAAPVRRVSIGLAVLALTVSCGRDVHTGSNSSGVSPSRNNTTNDVIERLRTITTSEVESVQFGKQRTDIVLIRRAGLANPDSEQVALASLAERLWQDTRLGIQSETLAVAVVRPMQPGAVERSTYFYYRSASARRSKP